MAQVALHPTDPNIVVLRYEESDEGLLYSDDGGRTFRMICGSSIEPRLRMAALAIAGDGRILTGLFTGMRQDTGKGCGFGPVAEFEDRWVIDLAADPMEPGAVFAVLTGTLGDPNGLMRRDMNGEWAPVGKREETFITHLLTTKTESGLRFYEIVKRPMESEGDGAQSGDWLAYVRVSDDQGETWREHPFDESFGKGSVRLEAVDPRNPDTLVAVIDNPIMPDEVLVSRDQGETFTQYLQVVDFSGLTFAPDGRLWIGSSPGNMFAQDLGGLAFASSLDETPTMLTHSPVECVAYQPLGDKLYVCQPFGFGTADPADGTFTPQFRFVELSEFIRCDGVDSAAMCEQQMCSTFCGSGHFAQAPICCAYEGPTCGPEVSISEGTSTGVCGPASGSNNAGNGNAGMAPRAGSGATDKAGDTAAKQDDGGCRTAHPITGSASWWMLALASLWVVQRRRVSARTPRTYE